MRFNKFKKFIKIFIKKFGFLKSGCIFVSQLIYNTTKTDKIMRTQARKIYTNEDLKSMLALEIEKCGECVWSDRRKTIEEMLRMRGVKF